MEHERLGLRELKKRQTRDSIAAAALKLTEEKGLSNVTIEEIALEAFISPRTFSNYFSSKEEAVLASGVTVTEEVLEAFSGSTSDDPPLKTLCELMVGLSRKHPERLRQSARMNVLEEDNQSLRPFRITQEVELIFDLSQRVAARTHTDISSDVYPTLVASAAISAMLTSLSLWAHAGFPEGRLPELIEESFTMASEGYPRRTSAPVKVEIVSSPDSAQEVSSV